MWIKEKTLKSIVERIDKLELARTLAEMEIFMLKNPAKFKSGDKIKYQDVIRHGNDIFLVGRITATRTRMTNYGDLFWTWEYELTNIKTGIQHKRLSHDLHYGPIEKLYTKIR